MVFVLILRNHVVCTTDKSYNCCEMFRKNNWIWLQIVDQMVHKLLFFGHSLFSTSDKVINIFECSLHPTKDNHWKHHNRNIGFIRISVDFFTHRMKSVKLVWNPNNSMLSLCLVLDEKEVGEKLLCSNKKNRNNNYSTLMGLIDNIYRKLWRHQKQFFFT